MSIVGVPVMTKSSFIGTMRDIGEEWGQALKQSIGRGWTKRERELVIEKGCYHEGVPSITVIADGGWSKSSHKSPYNVMSDVAIIIGKGPGSFST